MSDPASAIPGALTPLPEVLLEPLLRAALHEDLGPSGDVTSRLVIPPQTTARAVIRAREEGVLSGVQLAEMAFRLTDPALRVTTRLGDGAGCTPGDIVLEVEGNALSILMAERVALNFAGRLSGIATQTAAFVVQTRGTEARITCTRKTTPGLRVVEKAAVRHGGGYSHRFGLGDAVLIKDNHIAAAGGIRPVLDAVRRGVSHMVAVEIEVDTLAQLDEVLAIGGVSAILLDNMSTEDIAAAVRTAAGRMVLEASGNMRLERVAEVAATGVDYISAGALTHSARTLDLGLDI